MRVCQNRLPEQPAKSGLRNFMSNAPFPIFAKKHICEAKMVANFKNAFLIFRKEIFIYRFF